MKSIKILLLAVIASLMFANCGNKTQNQTSSEAQALSETQTITDAQALSEAQTLSNIQTPFDAQSPSEIAKKAIEASKNLDFKTIKQYLVEERIEELEEAESEMIMNVEETNAFRNRVKDAKVTVLSEEISEDGDEAVVKVRMSIQGEEPFDKDIDLVKVDGQWKIDSKVY